MTNHVARYLFALMMLQKLIISNFGDNSPFPCFKKLHYCLIVLSLDAVRSVHVIFNRYLINFNLILIVISIAMDFITKLFLSSLQAGSRSQSL